MNTIHLSRLASIVALAIAAAFATALNPAPTSAQCVNYGDYLHVMGWVPTPGSGPHDMVILGSLGFVADGAEGFSVMDLTDPANPAPIANLDLPGWTMAAELRPTGRYVYVSVLGGNGLWVIDVSNSAAPVIAGSVTTPGSASRLAASGNLVYFADGSGGFHVIDVTLPNAPFVASTRPFADVTDVAAFGSYALVIDRPFGLRVMDVSNPATPLQVASLATPGEASMIAVQGDVAYIADSDVGIQIVDLSVITAPSIRGNINFPPANVDVTGTMLLVTGANRLSLVDIADPFLPVSLGSVGIGNLVWGAGMKDHIAYTYQGGGGLGVIDATNPHLPDVILTEDTPGSAQHMDRLADAIAIADDDGGLRLFDVTDPATPTPAGVLPITALGVQLGDDYAYVASAEAGLVVADVSDIRTPVQVGSVDVGGNTHDVALHDTIAYAAYSNVYVAAVDVSSPSAPVVLGSTWAGIVLDIAVAYPYVYTTSAGTGLRIIDVSDPGAMTTVVQSAHISSGRVEVRDGLLYGGRGAIFRIWDVNDPDAMFEVGSVTLPATVADVRLGEVGTGLAYVSTFGAGVAVVDISDLSAPVFVGAHIEPDESFATALLGEYLYVAAGPKGLVMLPAHCESPLAVPIVSSPIDNGLEVRVTPNPSPSSMQFTYEQGTAGPVRLAVYDVRGREVARVLDDVRGVGTHTASWGGSGHVGGRVPAGVYWVRLSTPGAVGHTRITILN